MAFAATYLFELLPPIGSGPTKESVRVKRFGEQTEAVDYAKSMVTSHSV